MRLKKRLLSLVCVAVLVLGTGLAGKAWADTPQICLLAENNKMVNLSVEAMPAWISGQLYIPYTAFDRSLTGVNLGVSYGLVREEGKSLLTLYSLNETLTFDLNQGTCTDRNGADQNMRAVSRNGLIFLPTASVCSYFGLRYSYIPTDYGDLVRITDSSSHLTDDQFIQYAENSMRDRYNNYLKELETTQSSPAPSQPVTTARPTASPDQEDQLTVYLAVQCETGTADQVADQLEDAGVYGLFLFRPQDILDQGQTIRRLVGSGHAVGLWLTESTQEEVEEALAAGGAFLEQVAHLRTHTVYLEAAGSGVAGALQAEGWVCWTPQLDYTGDERSDSVLSAAMVSAVNRREGSLRLMVDDSAAGALSRTLTRLEDCRFRLPVETEIS